MSLSNVFGRNDAQSAKNDFSTSQVLYSHYAYKLAKNEVPWLSPEDAGRTTAAFLAFLVDLLPKEEFCLKVLELASPYVLCDPDGLHNLVHVKGFGLMDLFIDGQGFGWALKPNEDGLYSCHLRSARFETIEELAKYLESNSEKHPMYPYIHQTCNVCLLN